MTLLYNYPEWPHSQGGCLRYCGCTFESRWGCTDLYYARGAQGVLHMRVGGATSQFDLPSLTPLSVAGSGWLQLGVPHWAAHGLKNNTRLTRFFNPTKKKNIWWRNYQSANGGISVLCLTISRNAFVSRCIWFKLSSIWSELVPVVLQISKKLVSVPCWVRIIH